MLTQHRMLQPAEIRPANLLFIVVIATMSATIISCFTMSNIYDDSTLSVDMP